MLTIAEKYLTKGSGFILVDYGCGTMPYRPIFEPYVAQYIGVDLPGNEHADFYTEPSGKVRLPNGFADVILSTQVLEHVEQPMEYLRECYQLLKPGGLLILSTHGYWMYHPDPRDLWRWTSDGLKQILQKAGFQIVEFQGLMGLAATGLQLLQDGLMPKVPRFVRSGFAFLMQRLIIIIDKLSDASDKSGRDKDACIFIVVAKKETLRNAQSDNGFLRQVL